MTGAMTTVVLFLVAAAFTKSAQVPFMSWLPLAMRAPTPVSALVHSSTLVTAGVFILVKYWHFVVACGILSVLTTFGFISLIVAGFMTLAEYDMKKLVALSTLSQLGFMVVGLGMALPALTFLHLMAHAFFKCCLFIQIGGCSVEMALLACDCLKLMLRLQLLALLFWQVFFLN